MARKIEKGEFLERFYRSFPEADIEILEYTAITRPIKVKCKKCESVIFNKSANNLLKNYSCCIIQGLTKIERLQKIYSDSTDMDFIKQEDKDNVILHCNRCGNDLSRNIQSCLQSPFACVHCDTLKSNNMCSIDDAQKQLNEQVSDTIQILTYNGQLEKNTYKCLKCGLIFNKVHISLLQSRGCPKCDKLKSKGEVFIAKYLMDKGVPFEEQVAVKELPLQRFDFGIYDKNKLLIGFIEVQGEQHFETREIFRDGLEKIQERDNRKKEYCKKNNIPLYELIYKKGKFLNLDILPF